MTAFNDNRGSIVYRKTSHKARRMANAIKAIISALSQTRRTTAKLILKSFS